MRISQSNYFENFNDSDTPFLQMQWKAEKAPGILIRGVRSKDNLLAKLRNYNDFRKTDDESSYNLSIDLKNLWRLISTIILPLFWIFASYQIIVQLFTETSQSAFLTLILLLIVSFTFSSPLLYVSSRKNQDRLDELDQINLLNTIVANEEVLSTEEILDQTLYFETDRVTWKTYQSNWDLSIFYPEFTIFDILGLFTALFSIVYLFTWLVKVLGILTLSENRSSFRDAVLYLDLLLVLVFIGFISIGIWYGIRCNWSLRWDEDWVFKPILVSFVLLIVGVTGTLIIEFNTGQFAGSFVFFILMFEIPLISSFVINRIRLFIEFNRTRNSLIRIMLTDSFTDGERLKKRKLKEEDLILFRQLHTTNTMKSLIEKTPVPATRIRSYTLVLTAIFSLLTTILTAFIGSTDLFTELINSFFS